MHMMKRIILTLTVVTGFRVTPLISQQQKLPTVPLSAEIDVVSVRTLPDGNSLRQERKMKFYRSANGSTRMEEPNRVVITDNNLHTITVLDTINKLVQVQNAPTTPMREKTPTTALSQPPTTRTSPEMTDSSSDTDLGVRMIAGYSVRGVQRSTTIAPNSSLGNSASMTKTIQVWRSSDLRLPLLTVINDPVAGTITSQYQNISTATPPDEALFTIPAGYKITPTPQSRLITTNTN